MIYDIFEGTEQIQQLVISRVIDEEPTGGTLALCPLAVATSITSTNES